MASFRIARVEIRSLWKVAKFLVYSVRSTLPMKLYWWMNLNSVSSPNKGGQSGRQLFTQLCISFKLNYPEIFKLFRKYVSELKSSTFLCSERDFIFIVCI